MYNTVLGILFSSILCTGPNQRNLCNLIVSVMVGFLTLLLLLLLLFKYILYAKCLKFSLYLTEDVSLLQGLQVGNLRIVWNTYTCCGKNAVILMLKCVVHLIIIVI
jgi:hypothetical protein